MNLSNKMTIRQLLESDIEPSIHLFYDTVHAVNSKDYSPEQVAVWAPHNMKSTDERWQSLLNNIAYVAEVDKKIVGFADMTKEGYLDRLYVHTDFQHMGIASMLFENLLEEAMKLQLNEMTAEASITAKSFFVSKGFVVYEQQEKLVRGVVLINFVMKKLL